MSGLPDVRGFPLMASRRGAADPRRVVCPTCKAKGGKPCVRVMGGRKGTPQDVYHFLRKQSAERLAGLKECPTCHGSGVVRSAVAK